MQTGSALEENTKQSLEQSTQLQANTLAEWIERETNHVELLASSDAIAGDDEDQITQALTAGVDDASESVVDAHYVDVDGYEILHSTTGSAEGVVLGEHDLRWIEQGTIDEQATDGQVTTPYSDPVTGQRVIAIVGQVPGEDRAVVFVVDLEARSETLMRPSSTDGAFTHVVNDEGTVVVSHHSDDIGQQNMGQADVYEAESDAVQSGLDGESGYVEMPMGGQTMTMGYAPVEGAEWVIMTHIPKESAFALQSDIENSVIGLVVASLLGLGLIGAVIGRNTARSLNTLAEKAGELERGNLDTELSTTRVDEIGDLYVAFESMRDSLRETITEAETARRQAEHGERQLSSLASQLEEEAGLVMKRAADGDLTQRMAVDGDDEAMNRVVTEFNEMIAGIEQTVRELKSFATEVAAHSEEMTASVEEIEAASEQVSDSIQEISSHTERQNGTFQEVSREMNSIAEMTERVASLSVTVREAAEQTAMAGNDGRTAARDATAAMTRIDDESRSTLEAITELRAEMDRIEEMAELITELATQTNMLALNANIEATRDGTGSAGFGAVAEEVKSLAGKSKSSAQEIEEAVQSIHEQMERTQAEVQTTRAEITDSKNTIETAGESLEEIAEHAETTYQGVQEIASVTQDQAASTEEVSSMVTEAASTSDRVSEEAETVAAAAEEQTSSLHEVTRNANELAGEAQSLQHSLDQFTTGEYEYDERETDSTGNSPGRGASIFGENVTKD